MNYEVWYITMSRTVWPYAGWLTTAQQNWLIFCLCAENCDRHTQCCKIISWLIASRLFLSCHIGFQGDNTKWPIHQYMDQLRSLYTELKSCCATWEPLTNSWIEFRCCHQQCMTCLFDSDKEACTMMYNFFLKVWMALLCQSKSSCQWSKESGA